MSDDGQILGIDVSDRDVTVADALSAGTRRTRRPKSPPRNPGLQLQLDVANDSISDALEKVRLDIASLDVLREHLLEVESALIAQIDNEGFTVEYSDLVSYTRGYKLTLKL